MTLTERIASIVKAIKTLPIFEQSHSEQLIFKTNTTKKLPTWGQVGYFPRLLSSRERILGIIAAALLIIALPIGFVRVYSAATVLVPQNGGSYTEALVGTPQFINPLLAPLSDVDSDIASLVYSGIFRYDEKQQLTPDLITNYTISEDKKTYTFFLRHGVQWQDGEPMNAEDVMFTIGAIQDPLYQSPLQGVLKGVTATKLDDYSFSLALKEPFAPFLTSLTFGILPKHLWFNVTPQNITLTELNLKPVGTGPYVLKALKKDREGTVKSLKLEKYSKYYGTKPYIQEVNITFYGDEASAVTALSSKQVEGLAFFPASDREVIRKKNSAVRFNGLRIPQYTALFFNQKQSVPLQEGAVRKALSFAVNRDEVIQRVFAGQAEAIYSPILPGYVGYHAEVEKYLFNIDAANKLLDDAKWVYPEGKNADSDPFEPRAKAGKALEFTISTVDLPEYVQTVNTLQAEWKKIGVKVNINTFSSQDIQSNVIKGRNYEALLFGQIIGTDPDPYPFWHSSQQESPGLALSIFRDREIDGLLEQGRKATNDDERTLQYLHFQNNLAADAPAIFLYNPTYQYAVNKKIHGVQEKQYITVPSDRFSALRSWYIKTDRKWRWTQQ